jgi:YD repeat-containing protein
METTMIYDQHGELSKLTSKQGNIEIKRDNQGNVNSVQTSWGYRQQNTYAPQSGELAKIDLFQGKQQGSIELNHGKISRIQQFDGGHLNISYYGPNIHQGQVKEIHTPNNVGLSYEYDAYHRLARINVDNLYKINYRYDNKGRLIGITRTPVR